MNKLSIAVLVAATAAATGYVVSKVMKNKMAEADLYEDDFDDDCCDCCDCCDDEPEVVDAAEEIEAAADDVAEAVEDAAEEIAE